MKEMFYAFIFFSIIVADQLSKWWVVANIFDAWDISSFLSFEFALNKGISWSLFDSAVTPWFVYVAIFITIVFLCYHIFLQYKARKPIGIETAILAGAISNSIDRLVYGGVIDFITLHYKNWYFPSFNIADIAITLGVLCMIIKLIQEREL